MMTIKEEDIITCESYKGLCDSVYKVGDNPDSGLIHVNMEELLSFFEYCNENPHKRFVVVSSCSDFGLCEQVFNPVYEDIIKWTRMCVNEELGYNGIQIEPRCNVEKCKLSDKYSVKCYAWTLFTFNEIPSNIARWFTTNLDIHFKNERISGIPFGVPANSAKAIVKQREINLQKHALTYVNWTNYTYERAQLESYYFNCNDWVTVRTHNQKIPYEEYLLELSEHFTVLSPEGNGKDCYRNLEAVYLGVFPITNVSSLVFTYSGLPVFCTNPNASLRFSKENIKELVERSKERSYPNFEKAKLSYWKSVFENERLKWL